MKDLYCPSFEYEAKTKFFDRYIFSWIYLSGFLMTTLVGVPYNIICDKYCIKNTVFFTYSQFFNILALLGGIIFIYQFIKFFYYLKFSYFANDYEIVKGRVIKTYEINYIPERNVK